MQKNPHRPQQRGRERKKERKKERTTPPPQKKRKMTNPYRIERGRDLREEGGSQRCWRQEEVRGQHILSSLALQRVHCCRLGRRRRRSVVLEQRAQRDQKCSWCFSACPMKGVGAKAGGGQHTYFRCPNRQQLEIKNPQRFEVAAIPITQGKKKHINTNKCAGLSRDWVGDKNVLMCFVRVIPYGGEKAHKQNPPKKIPGKSRQKFVYVLFSLCVFSRFQSLRFQLGFLH